MEFNVNSWIDEAADSDLAKKRAAKSMAGNLTILQNARGSGRLQTDCSILAPRGN